MSEKTFFNDWSQTVIVTFQGSTCGSCGEMAFPSEGAHHNIPLSGFCYNPPRQGCGVEWRFAATTKSGMRGVWKEQMPQFTWVGVVTGEYPDYYIAESWLPSDHKFISGEIMKLIDIKNLNKAEVLAALFNSAKPKEGKLKNYNSHPMSTGFARFLIRQQKSFGLLEDRVLNIDLSGLEFDPSQYDLHNGEGAAERVIKSLRH